MQKEMMAPDRAVVLVSGGLDSCVTAALAVRDCECAFLHVSYGQRTEQRELRAFGEIADFFSVERRLVVPMKHLSAIGGSSLTDLSIPVSHAELHRRGVPTSYVPFRNANMLCAAVSWAEALGARRVYIGAVEEDSSGYPDCRGEFLEAFSGAVRAGTRPESRIAVLAPVLSLSKKGIVQTGVALGAPLHLTWSCYSREDVACGVCDSCALRLRGFQLAGVEDPIPYQQKPLYT
jgi:7-cyano-7-deazaguanine synthase